MKNFKYLLISLIAINIAACGTPQEMDKENSGNSKLDTKNEELTKDKEESREESEDISDLGLDNALLDLEMVE